jgi:ribosomal protein S6
MSVKISRLPLKLLWNSEYTIFVNQLSAIILKYKLYALHLAKAFGKVQAVLPALAKINARELSDAISNQLQELDAERDTLITAIVAQVKTMSRLSIPSLAPHVVVLNHFFDMHGHNIATANYNVETKLIIELMADYDGKPDVQAAATALNLSMLFEHMRSVNKQFDGLFTQHSSEVSAIEKMDARAIRLEADKALTAFFEAFEFCSSEYEDLDYLTPASEINNLVARYKTHLKARATRRNEGKDVSTEKAIA